MLGLSGISRPYGARELIALLIFSCAMAAGPSISTAGSYVWGASTDIPVFGDFDGDGKSDIAVWRPSTGYWYIIQSSNGAIVAKQWGAPSDVTVVGDFDGDGKSDIAVWRPSTGYWYIIQSSNGAIVAKQWGAPTDVPVVGDFDGDGKTDIAVWRPSTGYWYIIQSSNGAIVAKQWGAPSDVPVVGDFDGDGKTDIAVWRPSTGYWYIIQSSNGALVTKQWGAPTDMPVVGDFDGDGKTDIAVWRPSTGYWYILDSGTGQEVSQQWGETGDKPAQHRYDGGAQFEEAVWRAANGTWYILSPQAGWIWENGVPSVDAAGVYGTEGQTSGSVAPGARSGGATWTDHSGNLWMFGGYGYDSQGTGANVLNDLWKYVPGTAEWTWVAGSQFGGAVGVYGNKGTAAATNSPGARSGAYSWVDQAGVLWLFGGEGYDITSNGYVAFNDLWMFQPSTGLWTWVGGSSTENSSGVYGTVRVPSSANAPSARYSGASWIDGAGNFWLFGGTGLDGAGSVNNLNDLWKYTPSSKQWTWISGSKTGAAAGVYGTRGMGAAANSPGAREEPMYWVDAEGKFWLFGGYGAASTQITDNLNDLWNYNPSTGLWTWVSGSNMTDALPVFGLQGSPSASNVPGARSGAVAWVDRAGSLWMFGGNGYDSTGDTNDLSDLWQFDPKLNQWAWMGGSQSGGLYGTYGNLGIPSSTNLPGARYGAVSWIDATGNLWMFGGSGAGGVQAGLYTVDSLNDLWQFGTYESSAPRVTLTATPGSIASQGTATLSWASINTTTCAALGGWTSSTATKGSASTGPLATTTIYSITCTAAGGKTATASATVTVASAPVQQTFTYTGVAFDQLGQCMYQNTNICPAGPITATATFSIPVGYTGTVDASTDVSQIDLAISVKGYGALPAIQAGNGNLSYSNAVFKFVNGSIVWWDVYIWWFDPSIDNPDVQIANPPEPHQTSSGSITAADYAAVCLPADCTSSNFIGSGVAYTLTPGKWTPTPTAAPSAHHADRAHTIRRSIPGTEGVTER